MRVRLLVDTQTPASGFVHVGDVIDVEEKIAQRWLDYHIAVFANSETEEVPNAEPEEVKKPPVLKKKKGK